MKGGVPMQPLAVTVCLGVRVCASREGGTREVDRCHQRDNSSGLLFVPSCRNSLGSTTWAIRVYTKYSCGKLHNGNSIPCGSLHLPLSSDSCFPYSGLLELVTGS